MNNMNKATRVVASMFGVFTGIFGAAHGYFETLQGNIAPNELMINAIGLPCQRDAVAHACLPAMTIIPSFLVAGFLTIIFSLIALVWAAIFIQRKNGSLVLILMSILMLLVGGGFIPPFLGIFAAVIGTRINAPLIFLQTRISGGALKFLAKFWPWIIIVFVVWTPGQILLGYLFNQTMINLGCILLFFSYLVLPIFTVLIGFAYDIHNRDRAVVG